MRRSIRSFVAVFVLGILVMALSAQTITKPSAPTVAGTIETVAQTKKGPKKPAAPADVPATLRIHPVSGGHAEPLAKLLQEVFRDNETVRIVPLGRDKIAVWGPPDVHLEIARQPPFAEHSTLSIPLTGLDGARVMGL